MQDDRRRAATDERKRKPLPSPSIQHSEINKDASRKLGRPNPEAKP